MASSDGFTHFLLSMGSLEQNADPKLSSDTLFKILDFCQVLQKKHQSLEGAVNELRKENGILRAQVDKLKAELAQRVETIVDRKTHALEARLQDAEMSLEATQETVQQFVTLEEVLALAARREQDFQEKIDGQITEQLSKLATQEALDLTQSKVSDLDGRFQKVADRLQEWTEYRRLQGKTEMGDSLSELRTPFNLIHLLHPSKSLPLIWKVKNFSNFKQLARDNSCRRLYSRPFGIEKEGTVRCVLRVVVVMLPGQDVFQFALEVLHATKYKRKFDFRFQILSGNNSKAIVKTFSSTEACVPRYWFPQNELQPSGLVSFAFAVNEEDLVKGDMLVDDQLLIQVGLRE